MKARCGVLFDPQEHWVYETEAARALRRHFNNPDLFTYKHRVSGNWMVADWVRKGVEFFDLKMLGKQPRVTPAVVRLIESKSATSGVGREARAAFRERLINDRRREAMELQEDAEMLQEAGEELRRALVAKKQKYKDHPVFMHLPAYKPQVQGG